MNTILLNLLESQICANVGPTYRKREKNKMAEVLIGLILNPIRELGCWQAPALWLLYVVGGFTWTITIF